MKSVEEIGFDIQIGKNIRAKRLELGMSQATVAEHFGFSFQQVQKIEYGDNRVGAGRLYQFSKFFGVSPAYFFEGLKNPAREALNEN